MSDNAGRSIAACAKAKKRLIFAICSLLLWGVATGCASSEFEIVEPARFGGQMIGGSDVVFENGPLSYRMRSVEGRLVIRIENGGDKSMGLNGAESYIVDPRGQSHGIASVTIAPHSFVKLILPPLRPPPAQAEPLISLKFGDEGVGVGGAIADASAGTSDGQQWEWVAGGVVRMSLRYRREGSGEQFTHSFSLRRR